MVQSVLSQSFSNFELLLIDDGSTDDSLSICLEMSKQDARIKVITQKNEGVSVARNNGIQQSKGEFLLFIDSDDYIEPDTLEILMQKVDELNDCLIVYGYYSHELGEVASNSKNVGNQEEMLLTPKKLSGNFWEYYINGITNSPCNKLYKRNLIVENKIEFPEGIKVGEDVIFNLEYFQKIEYIKIIDKYLYHYIQFPDQSSKKVNLELSKDVRLVLKNIEEFIKKYHEVDFTTKNWQEHNYQIYQHLDMVLRAPYRSTEISSEIQKESVENEITHFNEDFPNADFIPRSRYDKVLMYLIKKRYYKCIHFIFKVSSKIKFSVEK